MTDINQSSVARFWRKYRSILSMKKGRDYYIGEPILELDAYDMYQHYCIDKGVEKMETRISFNVLSLAFCRLFILEGKRYLLVNMS